MAEAALPRARTTSRARSLRTGLGRFGLRGVALLYLGLMIVLPVAAIIQSGFAHGLTDLRSALSTFGAWEAIRLTLIMAAITAVLNGVMGTLLAYVLVRVPFPGRGLLATIVLPEEIVLLIPEYRGYDYFLIGDEIVIVDPRTLEIVAIIPA